LEPTEKDVKTLLGKLPQAVLDSRHWFISPDGPLSLIPFEALALNGRLLVEGHDISVAQSMSMMRLSRDRILSYQQLDRRPIPGDTPYERMMYVLSRVTRTMQREPLLTEAMTRAFMFADTSAAAELQMVGDLMERMFRKAMRDENPGDEDIAVLHIVADVWMANLVAWVTRRASSGAALRSGLAANLRGARGSSERAAGSYGCEAKAPRESRLHRVLQ